MFVARSFRAAAVVAVVAAVTAVAADAPLSRTELAKRGKPATALVIVEPTGVCGTAFVVHPSGLLVTNAHVVSSTGGSRGRIRVALRPGEPSQEVLVASVLRTDVERDLAVLKIDKAKGLTVLPLGDSDRLTELTELVGFGYPFGTRLAAEKTDLPAVTVSISSVTSLRRKGGVLSALQLDGALNPGHFARRRWHGRRRGPQRHPRRPDLAGDPR
jgi:S1-C subfamily serine protease